MCSLFHWQHGISYLFSLQFVFATQKSPKFGIWGIYQKRVFEFRNQIFPIIIGLFPGNFQIVNFFVSLLIQNPQHIKNSAA
jgi:hypothetical protein